MSYGYSERPAMKSLLQTILPESRIRQPRQMSERAVNQDVKTSSIIVRMIPVFSGTLTATNAATPAAWAVMRALAAATGNASGNLAPSIVTHSMASDWAGFARAYAYFDLTSVLRVSSEVVRATLSLFQVGPTTSDFDGSVDIVPFNGSDPPVVADFDLFGTENLCIAPTLETLDDYEGNYRAFVLNDQGKGQLSTAGLTKLGLRIAADTDDAEPVWAASDTDSATFEGLNSTYPPILTVEFYY